MSDSETMTGGATTMQGTGPIYTEEEARQIAERVLSYLSPGTEAIVGVSSSNAQNSRFSRSEITTQRDRSSGSVGVTVRIKGRQASAGTQRTDPEGLKSMVEWAEKAASSGPGEHRIPRLVQPRSYDMPDGLWFDATREVDIEPRIAKVVTAINGSEGYVSAGTLDISAGMTYVANTAGLRAYCRNTGASFQISARSKDNTGSGWFGKYVYDWKKFKPEDVTKVAVKRCEDSRNPQTIEPGRLTVVLEPDAYAGMVTLMMMYHMGLEDAEAGYSVFTNPRGGTKIGQQVIDERLTFVSDPKDPLGPFCPFNSSGVPFRRTPWIENGYLKHLSYGDFTAQERGEEFPLANPVSVRLQPSDDMPRMTVDQMIETCDLGVYVTRLTVGFADFRYMVFTGVTRDGTWLIERGKITKSVKNLRYLDSHLFFLNSLEAVGEPVLTAGGGMVLPPLRCRDFNFTAIADAV